jgi:hypothetical protein
MTTEIFKHPATYAIIGIFLSLTYIVYWQILSSVMYIKHLTIKKINKPNQVETIDPVTGNIVKLNQNKKFDSIKYDLEMSLGLNLLFICILALIFIECNL